MKNYEIINAINSIAKFVESERKSKAAKLSAKGEIAANENNDKLIAAYKPYKDSLDNVNSRYSEDDLKDESNAAQKEKEVIELLNVERDIELQQISVDDFRDGSTFDDIALLKFMIK